MKILSTLTGGINVTGGVTSDTVTLGADPTLVMQAVTKQYVDRKISYISINTKHAITDPPDSYPKGISFYKWNGTLSPADWPWTAGVVLNVMPTDSSNDNQVGTFWYGSFVQVAFAESGTGMMKRYGASLSGTKWTASTAITASSTTHYEPTTRNGHVYICTVAGTTGTTEPNWPTTSGGTVVDGTVTWQEAGLYWSSWVTVVQQDSSGNMLLNNATFNNNVTFNNTVTLNSGKTFANYGTISGGAVNPGSLSVGGLSTMNAGLAAGATGYELVSQSGTDGTNTRHGIEFRGSSSNVEARIQTGNFGSYNGGLVFQVGNSGASAGTSTLNALTLNYQGVVTTKNNTLDDGNGYATITGLISSSGIKANRSNIANSTAGINPYVSVYQGSVSDIYGMTLWNKSGTTTTAWRTALVTGGNATSTGFSFLVPKSTSAAPANPGDFTDVFDVDYNGNGTFLGSVTAASFSGAVSGNASTATKLATAVSIGLSGDATGSTMFDGSAGVTIPVTLANSGVTAGTYSKLTVNAKGIVTSASNIVSTDVTNALGYTPINKAGDTLSGSLFISTDNVFIGADTGAQRMGILKKAGQLPVMAVAASNDFVVQQSNNSDLSTGISAATMTELLGVGASRLQYKGQNIYHTGNLTIANYATLASPALTGTPTAPTASTSDNSGTIATTAFVKNQNYVVANTNISASYIVEPAYVNGSITGMGKPLFDVLRGDRTAFLPAPQIIIEQSLDGGTTWTDAGVSDTNKARLFTGQRPSINIPLSSGGVKTTNAMIRITVSGMKYNVPGGTVETSKYSYWNTTNVTSTERYFAAEDMWVWLGSNSDRIYCIVERSTGANPTTWITDQTAWMTGWDGGNYVSLSGSTFGGGTTQTGNYWNWRFTFRTASNAQTFNDADLSTSYTTSAQSIHHIKVVGKNVWTYSNNYMYNDHLYNWDESQNAFFPALVQGTTLKSTVATGTAPLTVSSTTVNTNLNADMVDGLHSTNIMQSTYLNSFDGMTGPNAGTSNWIRTTSNGLIPYQSGGASSLGTSSWPFSAAYANTFYGTLSGNASTASKLQTAQTITLSGDTTGSVSFDGSAGVTISTTLANSGVTAGTYTKLTVDAKGRVTSGTTMSSADITGSLGYTPVNKAGDTMTSFLTLNADPTSPLHAATKQYVDNAVQGLDVKKSMRAATTVNLAGTYSNNVLTASANGALVVDGVTLNLNDRVLVKDQTDQTQNGLYSLTTLGTSTVPWALTRTYAADSSSELTPGTFTFIEEGTTWADTGWVLSTNGTITLGTTAITFVQFSSAGVTQAGTGIVKTGTTLSLATSGVTAGTYPKVTVDTYGRVTGGSNLASSDVTTGLGFTPANKAGDTITGRLTISSGGLAVTGGTTTDTLSVTSTSTFTGTATHTGSVALNGGGTSTTPATSDNSTNIATTAFVKAQNYLTGNQNISVTGDATGSGTTSIALTLANSGVTAGTYTKLTVDAKGRVTSGTTMSSSDITTSLGYTPVNKAGDTMSGNLQINGTTGALLINNSSTASGAQTGITLQSNNGAWHVDIWTQKDQWWHAFGSGTGSVAWGYDGTNLKVGSNTVWHAGNLASPVQTTGATFTGAVAVNAAMSVGAGQNLTLQASSSLPNDAGDIIFVDNTGNQKGRIWTNSGAGAGMNFASSGTSPAMTIDASNNIQVTGNFSVTGTFTGSGGGLSNLSPQTLTTSNQWRFVLGLSGGNTWAGNTATYIPGLQDTVNSGIASINFLNDANNFASPTNLPTTSTNYNAQFTTYVYCTTTTTWNMGTITVDDNAALYVNGQVKLIASDYGTPPAVTGATSIATGGTASISLPVGWSRIDICFYNGTGNTNFIWTGSTLSSVVTNMVATPWFGDDTIQYNGGILKTMHNTLDEGHGNATIAGTTTLTGAVTANSTVTLNATPTASSHAVPKSYVDNSIQHLANNAHVANDPVDRYPSSISFFGIIGANQLGFPYYGTVTTVSGAGDNPSLFPYQTFQSTNGTMADIRYRRALSTSKTAWVSSQNYTLNTIAMPTSAHENGHYYKVITAGTGTSVEPTWPTGSGATVYQYGGSSTWVANSVIAQGSATIPTVTNGFYYIATTGGTSSSVQPTWSTTAGATVTDNGNAGTWAASTAYALGAYVKPSASNGMYYKCTTAGTSAGTAPTWSTTSGATIQDNGGATTWAATTAYTVGQTVIPATSNGYYYVCTTAGTTGGTAPTWPTTSGATISDASVVWTAYVIPVWTAYVAPIWTTYQAIQWQEAGTFWSPWQSQLMDDGAGNVTITNSAKFTNASSTHSVSLQFNPSTNSLDVIFA
jgi:hypothetical protein